MPNGSSIRRPLLLGHRGARGVRSIPENTIASFDRAMAEGCDGFEFDLRLTADGAVVVCHDPEFERIEIASATTRQLARLPRFEAVLKRYRNTAFLDIELKVAGLEQITLELVKEHSLSRGFVVSSFLPEVLTAMRSGDEAVPLGLICETDGELRHWRKLPVDYVIPHYYLLNAALLEELKGAGKKILVWTVNDSKEMLRCRDLGVDGIISDDPALIVRTLAT